VAADRLRSVLAQNVPVLVDADGLTLLKNDPSLPPRSASTLLTPHAGEASRLLDSGWDRDAIEGRRLAAVRELADRYGCTVLLKGSTTLIAEPGRKTIRVNTTGTPALATAGSGDVLSGLAGGLMATGLGAYDAASVAAWRHGMAARRAADGSTTRPIVAGDLLSAL
jgi:hydroxyethylthiazole kinase-like uncharacterized protein yjeF